MLFAVFCYKGLGNFKVRPNYTIKGWMLINGKSFQV